MTAGPAMAAPSGGHEGPPNTQDKVRMVANIFISFIGAGVLGLPYAFKIAGLLEGALIMTLVCYLSVKAMLLLIDCKYRLLQSDTSKPKVAVSNGKEYVELRAGGADSESDTEQAEGEARVVIVSDRKKPHSNGNPGHGKVITYSDVGFAAFGTTGRWIIDTALLVSQVGFCCAYLIFISENLASFIHGLAQTQWLILILPPLFFLTLIPDLSNLAIFSLFAQISNLFAFAVVFWFDFDHLHLASPEHRKEFSIVGFPFFFSVAIYCFEGAGMILSLEASAPDALRAKFRRYFVLTIISVTALYVTFGVSGYLSYGRDTRDIITLNLPHDHTGVDFAALVKGCLCFSLFFTYPIMLFPVTSLLEERLFHPSSSKSSSSGLSQYYSHGLRLGLVALTGLVVVLVPQFSDLMALVGATCCTLLAFIMPGMCHLVLFKADGLSQQEVFLDYALILTGVIGAIVGTLDAIVTISS